MLYVDEARGSDGVVNIYDKAKVEVHDPYDDNFYMMDTDELVKVTYRSPAKPTDEWLNFSEKYDKDYETITFYRKTVVDQPEEPEETQEEPEDKPEETPAETHVFQIKIGETYLVKDDEERIALDAPAYLSEDGYTMLPLRALLNVSKDGVQIDWNQKDKIATITYDDTTAVSYTHLDLLYHSARCRAEADWLVGMNASRAYTIQYGALLSIGRVQTPTLALIVEKRCV